MSKNNKLYNYLVNTFGISKEKIDSYIEKRLEELLTKALVGKLDSNGVEKMILNKITNIVVNGVDSNDYWNNRTEFQDLVTKQVRSVISDYMKENYEFEMKVIHTDTKVVKQL